MDGAVTGLMINLDHSLDTWELSEDPFINIANPARRLSRHINDFGSSNKLVRSYHLPISAMAIVWSSVAAREFLAPYREPNLPFDCALHDFNRFTKKGAG